MSGPLVLILGAITLLWLVQTGKFSAVRAAWTAPPATTNGVTNNKL